MATGHRPRPAGRAVRGTAAGELTPTADGTRLRQFAQIGPGYSGLSVAIERFPDKEERIIERRLQEFRAGIERNLAALREMAETGRRTVPETTA